jgi:integrase
MRVSVAFAERIGVGSWRVRYWTDAGVHATISGFRTAAEARAKAAEIDTDQRRGSFIDPAAGKTTVAAWARRWCEALDVAPATYAQYRSLINNHILPRWGATTLGELSGTSINVWASGLRRSGYADSTVVTIVKVLSMMLADAAQERLIPTNPVRAQRRGRRHHIRRREIVWATPEQAVRIALQAGQLVGPWAAMLVITAAWTGARWGELTGLQRHNLHLDPQAQAGRMVIDPRVGALHEVGAELFLGPPKTAESARTITLPPFLVVALVRHLQSHRHPHVFVTERQELLRRSNFARRALRPATDGNAHRAHAPVRTRPVVPGLTFHGLRHSHKTWMIADHIPDAAQARRLGHTLPDKIADIYSHIAPELDAQLLARLQTRWSAATAGLSIDAEHHRPPSGSASPVHAYLALPAVDPHTVKVVTG